MSRLARLLPLLALLLLAACGTQEQAPLLEGPSVGQIPLLDEESPLAADEVPRRLITVMQSHRDTVDRPELAFYRTDESMVDAALRYDDAMEAYRWRFVDALQFGIGGTVRRYHRGQERAVLAFHPEEDGTDYALLYGTVP